MVAGAFRTPQCTVVFTGQSLNLQPDSVFADTYPAQTMDSYPNIGFGVPALNGQSWTKMMQARNIARVTRYVSTAPKTILVMCGGTADLSNFGAELDDLGEYLDDVAAYSVLWRDAVAAAGKSRTADTYVINTTVTPAVSIIDNEAVRDTVNTALVNNTFGYNGTTYWNAVVDFDGHANLNDYTNTTYYDADQIHWIAAGCTTAAGLMVPALATAFTYLGVEP